MLQTNLIGRQFTALSKKVYTIVMVYGNGTAIYVFGEDDEGLLQEFGSKQITLIKSPRGADEDLRGIL